MSAQDLKVQLKRRWWLVWDPRLLESSLLHADDVVLLASLGQDPQSALGWFEAIVLSHKQKSVRLEWPLGLDREFASGGDVQGSG